MFLRLLAIFLFPLSLHAQEQTCELSGVVTLTRPTQLFCLKDFKISEGTRIITNGFPLQIMAVGRIQFGSKASGLKIVAFENAQEKRPAEAIYIYGRTVTGKLEIRNTGSSPELASGPIHFEYMSTTDGYDHDVTVSDTTRVEMVLNGQDWPLVGALRKPAFPSP